MVAHARFAHLLPAGLLGISQHLCMQHVVPCTTAVRWALSLLVALLTTNSYVTWFPHPVQTNNSFNSGKPSAMANWPSLVCWPSSQEAAGSGLCNPSCSNGIMDGHLVVVTHTRLLVPSHSGLTGEGFAILRIANRQLSQPLL